MRIVMTGAQGTGKSTILEALRVELSEDYYFSNNITRRLFDRGFLINEQGDDATQSAIMDIHFENIKREKLVADRCLLDCFCYTWYLFEQGSVSHQVYLQQLQLLQDRTFEEYDLICYLRPEFALPNDGVRSSSPEFQQDIANRFEYIIEQYQIPVTFVTGSVEHRIHQIKQLYK